MGIGAEQLPQPGGILRRNGTGSRLQRPDGRLGKGRGCAQQQAETEQHGRVRLAGHLEADILGEGHQADLDPFHEAHQADDHGQDSERNGVRVEQRSAQRERLKTDQHQRQRQDRAQLLAETYRYVRREQAVQIDGTQRRALAPQAFRFKQRGKADLALVALDGAEIDPVT